MRAFVFPKGPTLPKAVRPGGGICGVSTVVVAACICSSCLSIAGGINLWGARWRGRVDVAF
jgi:hypothetical protein